MLTRWWVMLGLLGVVAGMGCWEKDKTPPSTTANVSGGTTGTNEEAECCHDEPAGTIPVFHARLREIAVTYTEYGRFDGQMRWGSTECSPYALMEPLLPVMQASASQDSLTHGRKLYSIFAKILFLNNSLNDLYERDGQDCELRQGHYRGRYFTYGKSNPVGQVLIKESWVPEEIPDTGQRVQPGGRPLLNARRPGDPPEEKVAVVAPAERTIKVRERKENVEDQSSDIVEGGELFEEVDSYVAYVRKDGQLFHAAKQGPLFIMYKMKPDTLGTDEGWVYGTVTPDGAEVLSAGRVASCMNCHQKAPHDRLFGLPKN